MEYKAVVFDVDGVLTEVDSVWRYIHERLGTWERARLHRDMFFDGKIDYEEWARLDAGLWKGVESSRLKAMLEQVPIRKCSREVIAYLRQKGLLVFAISAGIDLLVEIVSKRLGIDYYVSNRLITEDGILTGEIVVRVGFREKGEIMNKLLEKHGIPPENTIAVGDSEVDIEMFRSAGLAIAYNPTSQKVIESADWLIASRTLCPLLSLFRILNDLNF